MSASIHNTKPNFAIFLDIDGVLAIDPRPNHHSSKMSDFIHEKLDGAYFHYRFCKGCVTCDIADAHFFEKKALNCLHDLINKIRVFANVHIILSSSWRDNRTMDELKEIFREYAFSNFLVDKTVETGKLPFEEWKNHCIHSHIELKREKCLEYVSKMTDEELDSFVDENWECRASQINKWINEHSELSGYLVIDDMDSHLKLNFKEKFISTSHRGENIFTEQDAEKAYQVALKQLDSNGASKEAFNSNSS